MLLINAVIGTIPLLLSISFIFLGLSTSGNTSSPVAVDNFTLFAFGHDLQAPSNGFTVSFNDDETLTIFSIGSDKFLYSRSLFENGTTIREWENLEAQAAFVTSIKDKVGNLNVILRGLDDVPYYKQQSSNGTWSPDWTSLGGQSRQIAVENDRNGNVMLFSIGKDNNQTYYKQQSSNGTWSPDWTSLGGQSRQIALENDRNGNPIIFSIGKGTNQTYYKQQFSNGTWSPDWTSLGGQSKFINPDSNASHSLVLFSIGEQDDVPYYKQQFSNGTWSPDWTSLGGQSKFITSVNEKKGGLILFSISKDDAIYYSYPEEGWKPLLSVGKSSQAAILSASDSVIHLFTVSVGYGQLFYYELENEPLPQLNDNSSLRVELVARGLSSPTSMAFLDPQNILILEKNTGSIRRVTNGNLVNEPILQFEVSPQGERGLLGITIDEHPGSGLKHVYIYLTESNNTDGTARNKLYRYTWENERLIEPKVLLDLPSDFQNHNGGKIVMSNTTGLFTVIGDQNKRGLLQNNSTGTFIKDTGVIFRINEDGDGMPDNPFINMSGPFDKYFAYGVRNSFGIAIDPVTNNLWDSENGDLEYDELNLVLPGLNSGWSKVMGPIGRSDEKISNLVNLEGSHYSDPVFSWRYPIGVTDIEFLNSSKLGSKYQNSLFVGDIHKGNLYRFDLDGNRSSIIFSSNQTDLYDHVADTEAESESIILGNRFGGITDISTSPDGFLYVLTFTGHLYRISSE